MDANGDDVCYYFAYGSNMNPKRMHVRNVSFLRRECGRLPGYTLVFNKRIISNGTAAANIIPDEKSVVFGVLYTCADDHVLKELDKYEGVGNSQYYRTTVNILLSNSSSVLANTYIAHADKCENDLQVHPKYLQHLLDAKDILPSAYFDFLCSFRKQII